MGRRGREGERRRRGGKGRGEKGRVRPPLRKFLDPPLVIVVAAAAAAAAFVVQHFGV